MGTMDSLRRHWGESMEQVTLRKIALLVADGVTRNIVIEAFRQEYPSAPIIHVGCEFMHQSGVQSIPLINIKRIIDNLKRAGISAFSYVGDLGMSRDKMALRLRGRISDQEDISLSTLFESEIFDIERALKHVASLLYQAGIRPIHLRETLKSFQVPEGWIVGPRLILDQQMFEARIQSLIKQIGPGLLNSSAMARSCFVFDGLNLIKPIGQNTELVLAQAKGIRVPKGEFRSFAKIATDNAEIEIAAPAVGHLTFTGFKAASVKLVILDHNYGVFVQKERSVEYCRKNDIAVFGYARIGDGSDN